MGVVFLVPYEIGAFTMLTRSMLKGTLITREAYMALLDLQSLVEIAVEKAHTAGLDTAGLGVSPQPIGDPLAALKIASETLQSAVFDHALADARNKIDIAMAWQKESTH
jgi:hypothetical protein